ncbi:MAG: Trm112 family protein [Aeropyrum sp.]|nr:Trm112 family protein [Aeropyrum sp.]MCE4615505.1 Trm112 family protein [Aeropyrum sp.]
MVRYYHLELLACPECRNPRLVVYPVRVTEGGMPPRPESLKCRRWCYLFDRPSSTVPVESCVSSCVYKDIEEGVIVCPSCGRWYPIVDGIPVMMDDKYRDEERDREAAARLSPHLPDWIRIRARRPVPL